VRIPVDPSSSVALYLQIEHFLRENILAGRLLPDTRLPSTRQLAQELGVSRITVQNAYDLLESDGLIGSREGSGTFVLPPEGALPGMQRLPREGWPLWQLELEQRQGARSADPPALPPARPPAAPLISFTGVGDPREFPVKDFLRALQTVLRRDGLSALEYGDFGSGSAPLRQTIAHVLASQGIQAHPENLLITSGSQQGLALVCSTLLKPGDAVLVESPTYNFALELFRSLGLKVMGVPVDEKGLCVEQLEPLLQRCHPKLLYTIPNFQNPSGACLSGPRRRQLLALADCYNVPVLEDDFAGDLRYDGRAQPAIKSLDPGGRVIYVGTFSKMLMPGLRVGFLAAEGPVYDRLVQAKTVDDLTTSPLMQRTLDEYVTVGRYQAHIRRSCRVYRKRRDAMLAAVAHWLPGAQLNPPQGGLFLWLRLPEPFSALDLLPLALQEGVEFTPGVRFFPNPADGAPYLRLNFATCTPAEIEEGIRRLGMAFQLLARRRVP
jgi:GntR family transcriptional regulator/MocR family aminotransferase